MSSSTNTAAAPLRSAAIWAVMLIGVDQVTKFAATGGGCGGAICPLRNDALMLGVGGGTTVNVVAAGLAGLAMFAAWVWAANRHHHVPASAAALVVAGIVANLIDRVIYGSVRDFLAVSPNAVINVADIGVIGGLAACTISALNTRRPLRKELSQSEPHPNARHQHLAGGHTTRCRCGNSCTKNQMVSKAASPANRQSQPQGWLCSALPDKPDTHASPLGKISLTSRHARNGAAARDRRRPT